MEERNGPTFMKKSTRQRGVKKELSFGGLVALTDGTADEEDQEAQDDQDEDHVDDLGVLVDVVGDGLPIIAQGEAQIDQDEIPDS